MAILDLITIPNPVLTQECEKITTFDDNLKQFVNDMFETMYQHQGIGLAAPQVGILERLCICEYDNDTLILINPEIIEKGEEILSEEACLSIPDTLVEVSRFKTIKIKAQTVEGIEFMVDATGMMAIIIQHEMDHLNGVLITSKGNIIKGQ